MIGIRLLLLAADIFACGYGVKQLMGGFRRKYFITAMCGMAALLFARIYYVAIVLSDGNDEILTVGQLGQASAYLFFMTANISFLSRDVLAKSMKKLYIPGLIGFILMAAVFIYCAVSIGTVNAYIGELICIFSMCGSFYIAANTISYRKENVASNATSAFNVCVCILAVMNTLFELAACVAPESMLLAIMWAVAIISAAVIVIMVPLLRRGMEKWPQ